MTGRNGKRVAIIGAGPGGLTAALVFWKLGFDVTVYERADELRSIGGGIALWPPPIKVLELLGVSVESLGAPSDPRFIRPNGKLVAGYPTAHVKNRPAPVPAMAAWSEIRTPQRTFAAAHRSKPMPTWRSAGNRALVRGLLPRGPAGIARCFSPGASEARPTSECVIQLMSGVASPAHTGRMDEDLLARADRIVAALSPGKRESIREIVIDSIGRGLVDDRAARFLESVSGSSFLGEVLAAAIDASQSATSGPHQLAG